VTRIENGVLVSNDDDYPVTAQDEYNNGRLDAHLSPDTARAEVARIDALETPSFAERHWARGVRSVLEV
jgi:hypothetical protein